MNLHQAAEAGDEQAVRDLLSAGADAEAADRYNRLPIHIAALEGHVGVVQLLMEAAPATVAVTAFTAVKVFGRTPLHCAALYGHSAVVRVLVEAAPSTVAAVDEIGRTPLDLALIKATTALEAARCLVRAAPTVQPTLNSLARRGQLTATLYTDLVSRLALMQQEWQSIPAPCPDLVRALPAVMERSVAEAGWLVGRLGNEQRARLRTGTLCLGRVMAGVEGAPSLPAELSQRILVAALADP